MERLTEQKLSAESIFEGRVIRLSRHLVRLENGQETTREVITHPGGVGILPMDAAQNVYMVRQFRYPQNAVLEEIPAGKLNFGEDPLACGKRELLEEIGATAADYTFLGEMYPTPAYDTEIIHLYLARGLTFSEQHLDADEFLEVYKLPFSVLFERVMAHEIPDAKTQIAVLKTKLLLGL